MKIDPSRTIPFVCKGSACENTCCGPFHGTRALEAVLTHADLGAVLGEEPLPGDAEMSIFAQIRLLPGDVRRMQEAGLDDLIVRRGPTTRPRYYMRLLEDGSCSALTGDRLCRIHRDRPTLCRAFPFYFDLFAGLSMVASCPGVGAGTQPAIDLAPELQAAVELYTFWLQELDLPEADTDTGADRLARTRRRP